MTPEQQREIAEKVARSTLDELDTFDIAEMTPGPATGADLREILRLVQAAHVVIVDPITQ